ncbi:MAG TPA: hypothetical protein VEY94_03540 [Patescibacteria group bacterium]|nr:hypothetical protein [Patescibacteria group bacterium]
MMTGAKLRTAVTSTLAAIVAAAPRLANACAMCGLSPGDHAGHAYNSSVLFMLASPYISFFAIGGVVYFVYRRSARQDRDAASKR